MKQQTRGTLMLFLCAMVWGAAFVAQSEGMNYIGPFTMQATRYFLSGLVLLPVIYLRDKRGITHRPTGSGAKRQFVCGMICGLILFAACVIQQYGIIHTTVGKSGFITTMYIILVPFLGLFVKLRVKPLNWLCAVVSLAGLYLLCAGGDAGALCRGLFALARRYLRAPGEHDFVARVLAAGLSSLKIYENFTEFLPGPL